MNSQPVSPVVKAVTVGVDDEVLYSCRSACVFVFLLDSFSVVKFGSQNCFCFKRLSSASCGARDGAFFFLSRG